MNIVFDSQYRRVFRHDSLPINYVLRVLCPNTSVPPLAQPISRSLLELLLASCQIHAEKYQSGRARTCYNDEIIILQRNRSFSTSVFHSNTTFVSPSKIKIPSLWFILVSKGDPICWFKKYSDARE